MGRNRQNQVANSDFFLRFNPPHFAKKQYGLSARWALKQIDYGSPRSGFPCRS